MFDDARLEADLEHNAQLHWLATAGARIRRAVLTEPVRHLELGDLPRGVLAFGSESRLVRAVLEPICPVPFMAWPGPGLPAWVGPLDLAVILGEEDTAQWVLQCAAEARRRGATLIVAAPQDSELAEVTASPLTTLIPVSQADPMAAAVAVLAELGNLGLGPVVYPGHVADAADLVAEACGPGRDLAVNPAKDLALQLADRLPLLWGGTVLAARASRRIAEAVRRVTGRPALAADAAELAGLLAAVKPRDPFADPVEETRDAAPVLVLLDADSVPPRLRSAVDGLVRQAEAVGVPVARISSGDPQLSATDVERYVTLLQHGLYGAAYLEIGGSDA